MSLFYGLIEPGRSAVSDAVAGRAERAFRESFALPLRRRTFPHGLFLTTAAPAPDVMGDEAGGTALPLVLGDLRLDNRAELLAALGLPARADMSDAGLVARAYSRWQADLAPRIAGDFAFALWDPVGRRLHLFRDRFGLRPLFWRAGDGWFAFASAQELLRHGDAPVIDEAHIGGFLAGIPAHPAQTTSPGVVRLRPASRLTWAGDAAEVSAYWALRKEEVAAEDRPAQLRDRLAAAVARQTAPDGTTGAMLSGGLDSSALALLAGQAVEAAGGAPLPSYSMVYPDRPELDERRFIDAVLARGRFAPHFLPIEDFDPIAPGARIQQALGGLVPAPGLVKTRQIYTAARADGVGHLLDGHGGDEVISHGGMRLLELAQAGRVAAVLALLRTQCAATGEDPRLVAQALLKAAPRSLTTRLLRRSIAFSLRGMAQQKPLWRGAVTAEFAARTQLSERLAEWQRGGAATVAERIETFHTDLVTGPHIGAAFEALGWLSASEGVEGRYPFFDAEVVSFCVSLPESEKLRRGETRSILTRAMAGIYPESVRRRTDKTRYNSELARGMLLFQGARLEKLKRGAPELHGILDFTVLRGAVEELALKREASPDETVIFVWKALMLHLLLTDNSASFAFRF